MEGALVKYGITLPVGAAEWCVRVGIDFYPYPPNPQNYIICFFGDEASAVFYKRRWNGRMGKEFRQQHETRTV